MWDILYIILKMKNVHYYRNILFLKPLKPCFMHNLQSHEKYMNSSFWKCVNEILCDALKID